MNQIDEYHVGYLYLKHSLTNSFIQWNWDCCNVASCEIKHTQLLCEKKLLHKKDKRSKIEKIKWKKLRNLQQQRTPIGCNVGNKEKDEKKNHQNVQCTHFFFPKPCAENSVEFSVTHLDAKILNWHTQKTKKKKTEK